MSALVREALLDAPATLATVCERVQVAHGSLPADRVAALAMTVDGHLGGARGGRRRGRRARAAAHLPEVGVRIARLRTTVVAVPQKRAYKSTWRRKGHGATALQAVLVELETDDGLVGIGEAPVVWAGDAEVTRALTEAVAPLVVGADALEPDVVRRRLYAETGMAHLGTQGISWALSGIDTALWDLLGRAAGQPLHRLWGGAWRTRSPFHADLVPDEPERMADDAREWVERGFRTLYLKVGFDPAVDEARVRAVREAVGDGPRIRIDANAAWSPALAVTLLTRLAPVRPGVRRAADPRRRPGRAGAAAGARAGADPGPRVEPVGRGHAGRRAARRGRRRAARSPLRRRRRGHAGRGRASPRSPGCPPSRTRSASSASARR